MTALLDSGANCSYISNQAIRLAGLRPTRKKEMYTLRIASGDEMPTMPHITQEVHVEDLEIQGHHEEIILDALGAAAHDIILGLP